MRARRASTVDGLLDDGADRHEQGARAALVLRPLLREQRRRLGCFVDGAVVRSRWRIRWQSCDITWLIARGRAPPVTNPWQENRRADSCKCMATVPDINHRDRGHELNALGLFPRPGAVADCKEATVKTTHTRRRELASTRGFSPTKRPENDRTAITRLGL